MRKITTAELFQVAHLMGLQLMTLNLIQQGNVELLRLEAQYTNSTRTEERRTLERQIEELKEQLEKLHAQFSVTNAKLTGLIVKLEGLMPA